MFTTSCSWARRAACRKRGELFYPVGDDWAAPGNAARAEAAKAVCARCPVQAECLDYALESGDAHAILGGLTPAERRRLPVRIA